MYRKILVYTKTYVHEYMHRRPPTRIPEGEYNILWPIFLTWRSFKKTKILNEL